MGMHRTTPLGLSIDDHEDGMYGFVGDDNAASAFPNAPTDGTLGLTSSAAVQIQSEAAWLFPETLIADQINGATCDPESSAHSSSDDGAPASVLDSEADDAGQLITTCSDKHASLQHHQDTITFVCVDDGMGPGSLNRVASHCGHSLSKDAGVWSGPREASDPVV